MKHNIKEYKNLIGLLLGPVKERPALFISQAKISRLPNFITGYKIGNFMASDVNDTIDPYFENPGFINWFFEKYNIESPIMEKPFLDEANGDEKKALDLFFTYLEEYAKFINLDISK
jgi:hypothetical protein